MDQRGDELAKVIRDFRREQVMNAARRLFGERGSVDVSVEDIAAEAGVSRSTVYNYFSSRQDLLQGCLEDGHRQLVGALQRALAEPATVDEHLKRFLEEVLERVGNSAAFFRLAVALQGGETDLGVTTRAALGVLGLEVGSMLDRLVRRGLDVGVFRPADPARITALVGQVMFGAVSARVDDPSPPSAADAAAELRDLLLFGLGQDREAP